MVVLVFFLVQWVNLTLTCFVICDIYKKYGITDYITKLLLLIPCGWIACATFQGRNLTEEFSLAPLFLCLDIALGYFLVSYNSPIASHNKWVGMPYGICFGFLALVRITSAALFCNKRYFTGDAIYCFYSTAGFSRYSSELACATNKQWRVAVVP